MRILCTIVLFTALLAFPAGAQTTGVPNINDYVVDGFGSGATSCVVYNKPGGGLTTFEVFARAAGLPVVLLFSVAPPGVACPCRLCSMPMLPSPCLIPFTACGGSNQSVDAGLLPPCFLVFQTNATTPLGGAGYSINTINVPAGMVFSTQAFILDPVCLSGSLPAVASQAYTVITL